MSVVQSYLSGLTAGRESLLARKKDAPATSQSSGLSFGGLPSKPVSDVGTRLMSDLTRDFGLTADQAAGVVGNLAHESAGFKTMQEVKPTVEGSRGGYGYAMWTGPRRKQFEAWAQANGLDPASYEANYGFMKHELTSTSEGRVLQYLRQAPDAATAALTFSQKYLRPGIPHNDRRVTLAQQYAQGK